MLWEVDVYLRDPATDHTARAVIAGAAELGIAACTRAQSAVGWLIEVSGGVLPGGPFWAQWTQRLLPVSGGRWH